MTAHELARILARGPDVPVVLALPGLLIEAQAAYYVGEARYLPADALIAVGPVVAIGAPGDPAFDQSGESAGRSIHTASPAADHSA